MTAQLSCHVQNFVVIAPFYQCKLFEPVQGKTMRCNYSPISECQQCCSWTTVGVWVWISNYIPQETMVCYCGICMRKVSLALTCQYLLGYFHVICMKRQVQSTSLNHMILHLLTHWGRDKMAAIFQTTFSNAISWKKIYGFWLRFYWSLFLRAQSTISQHWFRWWLGANRATSHYLDQ